MSSLQEYSNQKIMVRSKLKSTASSKAGTIHKEDHGLFMVGYESFGSLWVIKR